MQFWVLRALLAGVAVLPSWVAAFAQAVPAIKDNAAPTGTGSRTQVFDPAFFARFAPRTALDMVQQVPGFQLNGGSSDVRGLAGSAGNVVVNGARPSSKSEGLDTLLSRIPASSVVRIEVAPGDLYGADYAGKGQVVNLILSAVGGVDGDVTAKILRDGGGRVAPDLAGSATFKNGHRSVTMSGGSGRFIGREKGFDRVTELPTGNQREYRSKVNTYGEQAPFVSIAAAIELSPQRAARINARFAPSRFKLHQDNHVSPVGGDQRDDDLDQNYANRTIEIGGDVTRPWWGGTIKLVGLATRRKRDSADSYRFRGVGGAAVLGGFRQRVKASLDESVARISVAKPSLLGFAFESGAEVALNRLHSDGQLFSVAQGGVETRIDLPIDQATVSELRGEAFITLGRAITPRLRIDAGLRNEMSRLKVRGDTRADRSLRFFKPNATLSWQARGKWHGQVSVTRTVAQLDFFDFISAAELSTDRVNGGNADLEPQRAWEFLGSIEHPLLGSGQIRIEFGLDRINKLQDRILTPLGFDAPGNLGTGTDLFGNVTIDAPLGQIWKGVRAKINAAARRTRVEDPVTGEMRSFSGYYPEWEYGVELRRDAGTFAYGLSVSDRAAFVQFRTDEIQRNYNLGPYGSAFIEYRVNERTKATLNLENIFGTAGIADRLLFDPSRRPGSSQMRDYRYRQSGLRASLTVARTFGGKVATKPSP